MDCILISLNQARKGYYSGFHSNSSNTLPNRMPVSVLFNCYFQNYIQVTKLKFNKQTLITKIGPTALTSYARSNDDFSTLLNVVSVLQIEVY